MSKESEHNRRESFNTLGDRARTTKRMLELLNTSECALTDKQLAHLLAIDLSSVCSIRNSLVKKEMVLSNGSIRNTETGKMNTTWSLTNKQ